MYNNLIQMQMLYSEIGVKRMVASLNKLLLWQIKLDTAYKLNFVFSKESSHEFDICTHKLSI